MKELVLERIYHAGSTLGTIWAEGNYVCHTLELPWRNNQTRVSCIPEGRYPLRRRFTQARGWHVEVAQVPGRSLILFHVGNDADDRDGKTDSAGCILPNDRVVIEKGIVSGQQSRPATQRFNDYVLPLLAEGQQVVLTIKQETNVNT